MGYMSIWHWLIVLVVVLIIFGSRGKIASVFGDIAKGIKAFKKGLAEEEEDLAHKRKVDNSNLAPSRSNDTSPKEAEDKKVIGHPNDSRTPVNK